MTTPGEAYSTLRALLVANKPAGYVLRWQDEDKDSDGNEMMPDTPAPFLFGEFLAGPSAPIERGGGLGTIRHRNPFSFNIYVLVPRGRGLHREDGTGSLDVAHTLAARYRLGLNGLTVKSVTAYSGGDGAELAPKGLSSEVGNYFWSAVGVEGYFDLIG
jgi:hypothetical protein